MFPGLLHRMPLKLSHLGSMLVRLRRICQNSISFSFQTQRQNSPFELSAKLVLAQECHPRAGGGGDLWNPWLKTVTLRCSRVLFQQRLKISLWTKQNGWRKNSFWAKPLLWTQRTPTHRRTCWNKRCKSVSKKFRRRRFLKSSMLNFKS
jgi:hypothetical protein